MISKTTLQKLGDTIISDFRDNVDSRTDDKGKSFRPYSFGYWLKQKYKNAKGRKMKSTAKSKSGKAKFMSKATEAFGGSAADVDMTDTGNMLSALTVVKIDESAGTFTVGFENTEAATLAYYHNVSGAGRGRVLRKFMYLSNKQAEDLNDKARNFLAGDVSFKDWLIKELQGELS